MLLLLSLCAGVQDVERHSIEAAETVLVKPFDGAAVRGLALGPRQVFAATGKGLFASADGRAWSRFGKLDVPLLGVACAGRRLVVATERELLQAPLGEDPPVFAAVPQGSFAARFLVGVGDRFAVAGPDGTVLLGGAAGAWRSLPLPGVLRIAALDLQDDGDLFAIGETAAGVRRFEGKPDALKSIWTPFASGTVAGGRVSGEAFFLKLKPSGGGHYAYAAGGIAFTLPCGDRLAADAGGPETLWVAGDKGEILDLSGNLPARIQTLTDLTPTCIVDAGLSLVVGTREGTLALLPKPNADRDRDDDETWETTAKRILPAGLALPEDADLLSLAPPPGGALRKFRVQNHVTYALSGAGKLLRWSGLDEWTEISDTATEGVVWQDFAVGKSTTVFVGGSRVLSIRGGSQVMERPGNPKSVADVPKADLRRIFFGKDQWLGFSGTSALAVTEDPARWMPDAPAKNLEWADAAFGNDVWVVVGARGPGLGEAAVQAGKGPPQIFDGLGCFAGPLRAVAFEKGRFVAVGLRGQVGVSESGSRWTVHRIAGDPDLVQVVCAGELTGVTTADGALLVTSDFLTWREVPKHPDVPLSRWGADMNALAAFGDETALKLPTLPAAWPSRAARTHPLEELYPLRVAAWDAATDAAKTAKERKDLFDDLLHLRRQILGEGTDDENAAFLEGMFERIFAFEGDDKSILEFYIKLPFQKSTLEKVLNSLPKEMKDLVQRLAQDHVDAFAAKQAGKPAPVHPPRLPSYKEPPPVMKAPASADIGDLRLRAARGDAAAAYDLSDAYDDGEGVTQDSSAADFWLRRARRAGWKDYEGPTDSEEQRTAAWRQLAAQGSGRALYALGERLKDGIGTRADPAEALACWRKAIAAGNWDARVDLAQELRQGRVNPADPAAALQLIQEGAALGHARSIAELGWMHEAGAGLPADLAAAVPHYRRAAELGQPWAMRRLADLHLEGAGVPLDAAAAREWLTKAKADDVLQALTAGTHKPRARFVYRPVRRQRPLFDLAARRARADAGDAAALYDLAYAHWNGYGVVEDEPAGTRLLKQAQERGWKHSDAWATPEEMTASWKSFVEQGSLVALVEYAHRLRDGQGCTADPKAAAGLIRKAAEAGHATACYELAIVVDAGKDAPESLALFRRAAELGNSNAQNTMGFRLSEAKGAPKDEAEGLRWFRLAAEGGHRNAALNAAILISNGRGTAKDVRAAAGICRRLAGGSEAPVEPAEAAAWIRARAEAGEPEAWGVLEFLLRAGFGTPRDVAAAEPFALAALHAGTLLQNRSNTTWRPESIRQAAALAAKKGGIPVDGGRVAAALRILLEGTPTEAALEEAPKAVEPLRLIGLPELWASTKAAESPAGLPRLRRLLGRFPEAKDEDPEAALETHLFETDLNKHVRRLQRSGTTEESDRDHRLLLERRRRVAIARLAYGIGRPADPVDALAWAMMNAEAPGGLSAVAFLSRGMDGPALAAADARLASIRTRMNERK